jgi:hypothetical protein
MKWRRWWNDAKAYSGAKFGIKTSSLGQLENLLKHSGEVNNPKQMASNELIPSTMAMVEPKVKKKYKTKKEKDVIVEELMILN